MNELQEKLNKAHRRKIELMRKRHDGQITHDEADEIARIRKEMRLLIADHHIDVVHYHAYPHLVPA